MHIDPPIPALYSGSAAEELGSYAVARRPDGRVVCVTHAPTAQLQHGYRSDEVEVGPIVEIVAVMRRENNPSFVAISSAEMETRMLFEAPQPAYVTRIPLIQPSPPLANNSVVTVISAIPYGVIFEIEAARHIVGEWRDTVPGWNAYVNVLERLMTNAYEASLFTRVVFINDNAALGAAFLPPVPMGYRNDRLHVLQHELDRHRDADGVTVPRLRGAGHYMIHRRSNNAAIENTQILDGRHWLHAATRRVNQQTEVTLSVEPLTNLTEIIGDAPLAVIHVGRSAVTAMPGAAAIRQLYNERSAVDVEDDEDEEVDVPAPAVDTAEITIEDIFRDANDQVARAARFAARYGGGRRPILQNSQDRSTSEGRRERISAETRELVTRYGTLDWDSAELRIRGDVRLLDALEDGDVWNAVIYCVQNRSELCRFYVSATTPVRDAATWLVGQPLFRRLVQQTVSRELSLPDDVHAFIEAFLHEDIEAAAEAEEATPPWKAPSGVERTRNLRRLMEEAEGEAESRPGRRLDID